MSHTPGPWMVSAGEVTTADGDVFIAEVVSRDRPCAVQNPNEVEANARLIAAAPELLEACKHLLEWGNGLGTQALPCLAGESDRECWNRNNQELHDQLTAAIAKAEGV